MCPLSRSSISTSKREDQPIYNEQDSCPPMCLLSRGSIFNVDKTPALQYVCCPEVSLHIISEVHTYKVLIGRVFFSLESLCRGAEFELGEGGNHIYNFQGELRLWLGGILNKTLVGVITIVGRISRDSDVIITSPI